MNKIFIVEDDEKLKSELKLFLENSGYDVKVVTSFSNTINEIIESKSDLILLDINIPFLNGEMVCKELRKKITTPIIMITSKNTEIDELLSFNYGADDFIPKPFNTQILLARIERLLKKNNNTSEIIYNDLTVDLLKSMMKRNDKVIDLSKNELKIISYFIQNKGKIISRDEIMDYLWDSDEFIDDNTLTVNINRLRNKLELLGYKDIIITKRGQGYIILWK